MAPALGIVADAPLVGDSPQGSPYDYSRSLRIYLTTLPFRENISQEIDMDFEEVSVPEAVINELADGWVTRYFKTPSTSDPKISYYVMAVKEVKAGWSNGTATILCTCPAASFRQVLAVTGSSKSICKHSKELREVLSAKEVQEEAVV